MTHTLRIPLPDPAALAALAAGLRVWLLGVLAWLLEITGAERRLPPDVRGELAAAIEGARHEVFDILGAHLRLRLRPQRRTRVRGASHADPHRSRINARRAIIRNLIARPRRLSDRIRVLIDALDNLDALVVRAIGRIARLPKGAWVLDDAPVALRDGRTLAPSFADSS